MVDGLLFSRLYPQEWLTQKWCKQLWQKIPFSSSMFWLKHETGVNLGPYSSHYSWNANIGSPASVIWGMLYKPCWLRIKWMFVPWLHRIAADYVGLECLYRNSIHPFFITHFVHFANLPHAHLINSQEIKYFRSIVVHLFYSKWKKTNQNPNKQKLTQPPPPKKKNPNQDKKKKKRNLTKTQENPTKPQKELASPS